MQVLRRVFARFLGVFLAAAAAVVLAGATALSAGGPPPAEQCGTGGPVAASPIAALMAMLSAPDEVRPQSRGEAEPAQWRGGCAAGMLPTGDGYCIPRGADYCGGGRHCMNGACLPGGRGCCPFGSHWRTTDGYCVPRNAAYCGGGRYCTSGRCIGIDRCG